MKGCFCYILLMSALSFLLMGWDKRRARRGGRRVPERVLLLAALLGGSPGAVLGMYCFRHKTRHPRFSLGLPALLLLQAAAALWLRTR
ncbi:MAG: DUF1294 domain-containing protein [Clostridiales bacterium]|nr:DUF1294 domain-containing protein [Clostridiales bacterium]